MPRKTKTWAEKLAAAKAKTPAPHRYFCEKSQRWFVIPAVEEIEGLMRGVREGRLMTIGQMLDLFRDKHDVEVCCPMTTGIFAWIIAHAADEQERAGSKHIVPWWRILKTDGSINPKWPGAGKVQRARLQAEGHRVVPKGKRLVVADMEGALVGSRKPGA